MTQAALLGIQEPELVASGAVTRVQDEGLCSRVVEAGFVPSDLSLATQEPELVASLSVAGEEGQLAG